MVALISSFFLIDDLIGLINPADELIEFENTVENKFNELQSEYELRLEQARLEQARLEQARLEQARLEQAKLEQAKLEQAKTSTVYDLNVENVAKPNNYQRLSQALLILTKYQSTEFNFEEFDLSLVSNACLNDVRYKRTMRGLARLVMYYYALQRGYQIPPEIELGKSLYPWRDSYPSVDEMLQGMTSAQAVKYFGRYMNSRDLYFDFTDVYLVVLQLLDSHNRFYDHITEEKLNILIVRAEGFIKHTDFEALGFQMNENKCYLDMAYLDGISIVGRERNTSILFGIPTADGFFMSFWLRRHIGGTSKVTKKLLDIAKSTIEGYVGTENISKNINTY